MCYKQKCKVVSLNLAHPVDVFNMVSVRHLGFSKFKIIVYFIDNLVGFCVFIQNLPQTSLYADELRQKTIFSNMAPSAILDLPRILITRPHQVPNFSRSIYMLVSTPSAQG